MVVGVFVVDKFDDDDVGIFWIDMGVVCIDVDGVMIVFD